MKKLFTGTLAAFAIMASLVSCDWVDNIVGADMDAKRCGKMVIGYYQKYVDTTQYKPVEIHWQEEGKMTNKFGGATFYMVGTDGATYVQSIPLSNGSVFPSEITPVKAIVKTYDFATVQWLRPSDIHPEELESRYAQAKTQIPEGYRYQGVAQSRMKIDPESGERADEFEINITKIGEGKDQFGRNTFYRVPFAVEPDGSVTVKE